jgi:hypothetical protein
MDAANAAIRAFPRTLAFKWAAGEGHERFAFTLGLLLGGLTSATF